MELKINIEELKRDIAEQEEMSLKCLKEANSIFYFAGALETLLLLIFILLTLFYAKSTRIFIQLKSIFFIDSSHFFIAGYSIIDLMVLLFSKVRCAVKRLTVDILVLIIVLLVVKKYGVTLSG